MPTNVFFNHAVSTEQHLYEDLVVESLRFYGHETYYLPRQIIEEDNILGEDVQSTFGDAYSVEMYLDNVNGYEGQGDIFTRFGLEVRDQEKHRQDIRFREQNLGTRGRHKGERAQEGQADRSAERAQDEGGGQA